MSIDSRGTKPGDLPLEFPTKIELAVDMSDGPSLPLVECGSEAVV